MQSFPQQIYLKLTGRLEKKKKKKKKTCSQHAITIAGR